MNSFTNLLFFIPQDEFHVECCILCDFMHFHIALGIPLYDYTTIYCSIFPSTGIYAASSFFAILNNTDNFCKCLLVHICTSSSRYMLSSKIAVQVTLTLADNAQ